MRRNYTILVLLISLALFAQAWAQHAPPSASPAARPTEPSAQPANPTPTTPTVVPPTATPEPVGTTPPERTPEPKPSPIAPPTPTAIPVRSPVTMAVPPSVTEVRRLMLSASVQNAFQHVEASREAILKEWIAITEINAPSGEERERAEYIERELRKLHLDDVHFDGAGNVVGIRKGTGGGPRIVIDAHMDTVFKAGLKIKAVVRGGNIYAPGVGDDTRNIEAMLAMIRALNAAKIKTRGDLIFLFTVGEESNMGGAKFFAKENKGKVDHFIALDGGYDSFTYAGIGIYWYKIHFVGPGGHTRLPSPPYSAVLAMSRAITRIYQINVPAASQSFMNIGMVGGAEVVNAKAADAWFTLDLRSTDEAVIREMKRQIDVIVREEAARERLRIREEIVTETPVANMPGHRYGFLVKTSEAVFRAMGFNPAIGNSGSNNASAAINHGISAISTGSGPCANPHALTEACEIAPLYRGIKKLILLGVTLAQLDPRRTADAPPSTAVATAASPPPSATPAITTSPEPSGTPTAPGKLCEYWQSKVDPTIQASNPRADSDPESPEVLPAIACLLKLKGRTDNSLNGSVTRLDASQTFGFPSVEVLALYYISYLFTKQWDHSSAIALVDETRKQIPAETIARAFAAYEQWFEQVKQMGLEKARQQKLDPLAGTGLRWY